MKERLLELEQRRQAKASFKLLMSNEIYGQADGSIHSRCCYEHIMFYYVFSVLLLACCLLGGHLSSRCRCAARKRVPVVSLQLPRSECGHMHPARDGTCSRLESRRPSSTNSAQRIKHHMRNVSSTCRKKCVVEKRPFASGQDVALLIKTARTRCQVNRLRSRERRPPGGRD